MKIAIGVAIILGILALMLVMAQPNDNALDDYLEQPDNLEDDDNVYHQAAMSYLKRPK